MDTAHDFGIRVAMLGMGEYFSNLKKTTRNTIELLDKTDKEVKKVNKTWRQYAKELPIVGRAMELMQNPVARTVAGLGILAFTMSRVVGVTADFENAWLELANLNTDKSVEQLAKLKDQILDTALASGRSAVEISTAYYDIQSATGLFGDAVDSITRDIADFSTATKTDFNVAVGATVKAMRAFKLEAQDIPKYLAGINSIVAMGITTFDTAAKVYTDFGGAAAGAGQRMDTANKVFAAATITAKSVEEAATSAKGAFEDWGKKSTVEAIEGLDVAMYDANKNARQVDDVLTDLIPKLQSMSQQDFDQLLEAMGGSQGLKNLIRQARNEGEGMIQMFADMDAATESFDLDTMLKNAKGDFTTLKTIVGNQLNTVMIMLGENILPIIAKGLEWVSRIIPGVVEFTREHSTVLKVAAVAAGAFAVSMVAIKVAAFTAAGAMKIYGIVQAGVNVAMAAARSIALTAQAAVIAYSMATNAASGAMRAFSVVIKSTPIGLIVAGAAALVAVLIDLSSGLSETERNAKLLNDVNVEAAKIAVEEKVKLQDLLMVANDKSKSDEQRQAAMKAINAISPEYLGNLTLEKLGTEEATQALEGYIAALDRRAKAEAAQSKRKELYEQLIQIENAGRDNLSTWEKVKEGVTGAIGGMAYNIATEQERITAATERERKNVQDQIDLLNDYIKENQIGFGDILPATEEKVTIEAEVKVDTKQVFDPESIKGMQEQLSKINDEFGLMAQGSKEWERMAGKIGVLSEKLAFAQERAKLLGGEFEYLAKVGPDVREEFSRMVAEGFTPMTYAVEELATTSAESLDYTQRQILNFQIGMIEAADMFRDRIVNGIGEAFFTFGKILGETGNATDGMRQALVGLGMIVLSEIPKYIGLFMLQTAVALGFPAGIPFAAAGIGLLAFSGIAAGLLQKISQGAEDVTAPALDLQSQGLGAQLSGATGANGLSDFNAATASQNNPDYHIYIGNERVTDFIVKEINRRQELQGN